MKDPNKEETRILSKVLVKNYNYYNKIIKENYRIVNDSIDIGANLVMKILEVPERLFLMNIWLKIMGQKVLIKVYDCEQKI